MLMQPILQIDRLRRKDMLIADCPLPEVSLGLASNKRIR